MCFWQGFPWTRQFLPQPASEKAIQITIYKELAAETQEIRLATIAPPSLDSEVRVTLRTVPLADVKGKYRCLSYAWGSQKDTMPILVDGVRCQVTNNLYSLLRRLRAMKRNKDIWIDAICIDQFNRAEKESQVSMMQSIYKDAAEVLIGLDGARTQSLEDCPNQHTVAESTIRRLANDSHIHELEYFLDQASSDKPSQKISSSFGQILDSSWFDRTWVVQETCLARKALFLCPWGELEWDTFNDAFFNWNKHSRRSCCYEFTQRLNDDLTKNCHRMYLHVRNISHTKAGLLREDQHITEPMLDYQHLAVAEHRDKIYAFHGLHTGSSPLPPPDYNSTLNTFRDFVLWYFEDKESLFMLCFDMCFGDVDGLEHCPTWIPTWPTFRKDQGIERGNRAKARAKFLLQYSAAPDLDMKYDWSDEHPERLRLNGFKIGDKVVDRAKVHFTGMEKFVERVKLIKAWYKFACPGQAAGHDTLQDMPRNFCLTMLAGILNKPGNGGPRLICERDAAVTEWKNALVGMQQEGCRFRCSDFQTTVIHSHDAAVTERVVFRTQSGRLGLGPHTMKSGDEIFLLGGARAPFLLRPVALAGSYGLVGHCYINGMMNEEIKTGSIGTWVNLV